MAQKIGSVTATVGALTDVDATARNPVGTKAYDANGGEYIYLKGVASTILGSWVTYDHNYETALLAANAVGQVAVALAAVVASKWGWYCIQSPSAGVTGSCDAIAANKACYIDATSGRVDDASVAGDLVCGAISRSGDSANLATFQIDHPFVNDVLG